MQIMAGQEQAAKSPVVATPRPVPDAISSGFWQAAGEGRLVAQSCDRCARLQHPPEPACRSCGHDSLSFAPLSGRATLYSWTILHDAPAPGFQDRLPLILGVVELAEQPHLLMSTALVDMAASDLALGRSLVARFEPLAPDCTLVHFAPAEH